MSAQTVAEVPVLRVLPIPVAEPRPALRVVPPSAPAGVPAGIDQGTLILSAGPGGHRSEVEPSGGLLAPGGTALRTEPRPLPPAAPWARQFVQAALEVAAGRRPPNQLVRWACEDVFSTLARRASRAGGVEPGAGAAGARPPATAVAVRSVRVCRLADDLVEAGAVVTDRGRIRAVALRMEGADGRWRVTALEIG